jgi:hypothetical protein
MPAVTASASGKQGVANAAAFNPASQVPISVVNAGLRGETAARNPLTDAEVIDGIRQRHLAALVIDENCTIQEVRTAWEKRLSTKGFDTVLTAASEAEALERGYFATPNLALVLHSPQIAIDSGNLRAGMVAGPMELTTPDEEVMQVLRDV